MTAFEAGFKHGFSKQADQLVAEHLLSGVPEVALTAATSALPSWRARTLAARAMSIGNLAALYSGYASPGSEPYPDTSTGALVPFAGATRIGRRIRMVNDKVHEQQPSSNSGQQFVGEITLPTLSLALGAAAGAGIGSKIDSTDKGPAMGAIGGLGATSLATLIGALAAAATKRRTIAEQAKNDTTTAWKNLIPGVGTYNYYKRLGASRNLIEDKRRKQQ